jgi:hypothetical protein
VNITAISTTKALTEHTLTLYKYLTLLEYIFNIGIVYTTAVLIQKKKLHEKL